MDTLYPVSEAFTVMTQLGTFCVLWKVSLLVVLVAVRLGYVHGVSVGIGPGDVGSAVVGTSVTQLDCEKQTNVLEAEVTRWSRVV